MFILDVSLDNEELYKGLKVHRHPPRRPRLDADMLEGFDIVKRNAASIFEACGFTKEERGDAVTLTSSMLTWASGAVIGAAIEYFDEVYYTDGVHRKLVFSHKNAPDISSEDGD